MKIFILRTSGVKFQAESIDDAFQELAHYFQSLADGKEVSSIFIAGEIKIYKEEL